MTAGLTLLLLGCLNSPECLASPFCTLPLSVVLVWVGYTISGSRMKVLGHRIPDQIFSLDELVPYQGFQPH